MTEEQKREYMEKGSLAAYKEILSLLPGAESEVWEAFRWEHFEVRKMVVDGVKDIVHRLEKAREVYKVQQAIIGAASQLTIDDYIDKQ